MEIPLYLAMTAAEFHAAQALPTKPAWMACHFSPYGTGLSNIPQTLPPGAMLMLNDRIPLCGHDPQSVAQTLCDTAKALESDCILLDLQRKPCDGCMNVIRAVLKQAGCPVGVSALYAKELDCPVLLPPIPPHRAPKEALAEWAGREIWLELSAEGTEIEVTEQGSRYTPLPGFQVPSDSHAEEELLCHYKIITEEDRILFQIGRTPEDQAALIQAAIGCGVTKAVGLWQEKSLLQTQQAQEILDQPKASSASLKAP